MIDDKTPSPYDDLPSGDVIPEITGWDVLLAAALGAAATGVLVILLVLLYAFCGGPEG